ncbi:MAG: T9SS type A sorting domain-containing protein, partial [Bacteroidia bacterium]
VTNANGCTQTQPVTIAAGTAPSAIITATTGLCNGSNNGSAIVSGSGGTFTPNAGTVNYSGAAQNIGVFSYNNLTLSGSGLKTVGASTVNGILSMEGTASASAAPTYGASATLQYNTTTSATAGPEWITPFIASGGIKNINSGTITIPGSVTVSAPVNLTGGKIAIGANTLTINGSFSGSAANSLQGNGATSSLSFGTSATGSTIYFDQTTSGTTNNFVNLTYNCNGQTITLGNALQVTRTVTPTAGTLASGGNLTLISNSSGDARVAQGLGSYLTGTVIVQRYIPSSMRRYRFLSSPVSGTNLEDWKSEMFITGNNLPSSNQSATVGQKNWGFDATQTNNPTVYYYDETIAGSSANGWVDPKSSGSDLTGISLVVTRGYRVFARGDRSSNNRLSGTDNSQNAVTLDLRSTINSGSISVPSSVLSFTSTSGGAANDGWCLVGNPYPCQFDWNAFHDAGRGAGPNYSGTNYANINPTAYLYNGATGSYDSYNALSNTATGTGFTNGIVPSGGSFYIQTSAASPSMTFTETYKSATTAGNLFKTSSGNNLSISLIFDSVTMDNAVIKYLDGSTPLKDDYDITKWYNSEINISSYGTDSVQLAANVRPVAKGSETIPLQVLVKNDGNYKMKFSGVDQFRGSKIYLLDKFLNLTQPVAESFEYTFTITTKDPSTEGLSRFAIVIGDTVISAGVREVAANHNPVSSNTNSPFRIYPNPVSEVLIIRSDAKSFQQAEISIVDMLGKKISDRKKCSFDSNGDLLFPVSDLPNGIYFVTLKTESGETVLRFVK